MNNTELLNYIADKIKHELGKRNIPVLKLILFGSRARGDERADSDWDILAVTGRTVEWKEKREIWFELSSALSEQGLSVDIMIKSDEEFSRDSSDKGKVSYYSCKEGVML